MIVEHVSKSKGVQWSGIWVLMLRGLSFSGARWVEDVDAGCVPCHGRKANWICCGLRKDRRRGTLRMSVNGPTCVDGLRFVGFSCGGILHREQHGNCIVGSSAPTNE